MTQEIVRQTNFGKRPVVERLLRIHALLLAGRRVTASVLARDFECAPKTLHRDFDFMRDRLRLPIVYDRARHTWAYQSGHPYDALRVRLFGSLDARKL